MKQFYLKIEGDQEDSYLIKHIQYNIIKRIEKIKYYKYRRIDITLSCSKMGINVEWNDKQSARLTCGIPSHLISSLDQIDTIKELYKTIFDCLTELWLLNGWDSNDVLSVLDDIKNDNYLSVITYGKELASPDKKHKAKFSFEIFPSFANYYVEILNRKKELIDKILFLKGQPNLLIFFLFFPNYYWVDNENFVLRNMSKEIFFLFNISKGIVIEYKPSVNTLEECKGYVEAFQFDKKKEQRLKLLNRYFEKNYDDLVEL